MSPKNTNTCSTHSHRSECPLSCCLELIGDKWTLLIIRDVLTGKHLYGDFEKSAEQIPTNILSDRLKKLVREGIMEKTCYQQRPPRYAYKLTNKGADLIDVLKSIIKWGISHEVGAWQPPENFWALSPSVILKNQENTIKNLLANKGQKSDA